MSEGLRKPVVTSRLQIRSGRYPASLLFEAILPVHRRKCGCGRSWDRSGGGAHAALIFGVARNRTVPSAMRRSLTLGLPLEAEILGGHRIRSCGRRMRRSPFQRAVPMFDDPRFEEGFLLVEIHRLVHPKAGIPTFFGMRRNSMRCACNWRCSSSSLAPHGAGHAFAELDCLRAVCRSMPLGRSPGSSRELRPDARPAGRFETPRRPA